MADLENIERPADALVDNADEAEQVVPDREVGGLNIADQEANVCVDEEAEEVLILQGDDLEEGIALPEFLRAEGGGGNVEDLSNEKDEWKVSIEGVKDIRRTLFIVRTGGLIIGTVFFIVAITLYSLGLSEDPTMDAKGTAVFIGIATISLSIGTACVVIAGFAWIKEHQQSIGLLSCPDWFWNFFARRLERNSAVTVRTRRGSDVVSVASEVEIVPENQNVPANLELNVQEQPRAEDSHQMDVPVDVNLQNDPSNEEKTADVVAVGAKNIDNSQPSTSIGDISSSFSSPYLASSTSPDQIPPGSGETSKQTSVEASELVTESSISEIASSVSEGPIEIGKEQTSTESAAESPKAETKIEKSSESK